MKNFFNKRFFRVAVVVLLFSVGSIYTVKAQNVAINTTGIAPVNTSVLLDLSNNLTNGTTGFLAPYVALTATNAASPLTAPPAGLIVYNTATAGSSPFNVVPGYYYWNGTAWLLFTTGSASNSWGITGNSNIVDGTNFFGTTNTSPVNFQIDGSTAGRIDMNKFNTFLGYKTTPITTTGTNNVSIGYNALNANTSANDNTAVGSGALQHNTVANNTAVGYNVLNANTTGTLNTAVGYIALTANTIGTRNVAMGDYDLFTNTTGGGNTAFGSEALPYNTTASDNTAIGGSSLFANTTGSSNTAVGDASMQSNKTGNENTAIGSFAGANNTTGSQNTCVGRLASQFDTNGSQNSALGDAALNMNVTGSNNTAIGYHALFDNTVGNNTALGYEALTVNSAGTPNTAVGYLSLTANTTGTNNVAVGDNALLTNTTGNQNTALGSGANVASAALTNATAIGYNSSVSTSNTMTMGSNSVTQFEFNGALMPYYGAAYNAGTVGQILTSQGAAAAPQWSNPVTATTLENYTSANVTLTTIGTWQQTGATISLTAGIWMVTAEVTLLYTSAAANAYDFEAYLGIAGTAYTSGQSFLAIPNGETGSVTISLSKIITVAATTSIYTYFNSATEKPTCETSLTSNSKTANTATGIHAVRLQ